MKKKIYIGIGIILTLLLLVTLLFSSKKKTDIVPFAVISTTPKSNEHFVANKQEVVVTLNRNININEGDKLKIQFDPDLKVGTTYQENKIRSIPENIFEYGIKYKVSVIFEDKEIYNFEFTANPFTPEQLKEEGELQTKGDIAYNEAVKKIINEYPWYTKLPIETSEYRIVYDWDKEMFRIRILKSSANIEEALLKLEEAGAVKPIKYYTMNAGESF